MEKHKGKHHSKWNEGKTKSKHVAYHKRIKGYSESAKEKHKKTLKKLIETKKQVD